MVELEGLKKEREKEDCMWYRKLWVWEENNYKQSQKREALWTAAVLCWATALCLIYWAEHSLYGGVVETNTFLILGISIGLWLRKVMGKEEKPITKRRKWITGIIVAISLAIIIWGAVFHGMTVYMIQLFFVLPVLHWSDYEKKKDIDRISLDACTLFFAAMLLVAGTLAGARLTGTQTTGQAEKTIQTEGFEEVEYLGWMYGYWVYQDAVDKSFYQESMEMEKYYMLFGRKDGVPWRFVVDPKGGVILIAATEADEPMLGEWYRSRETGE